MSQINTLIDTIKDTKSTILKTFVTDKQFLTPLQDIVNAEAALAKNFVKTVEDFATKFKVA